MLHRLGRVGTAERQQIKQGVNRGDKNTEISNKNLNITGENNIYKKYKSKES